MTINETTLVEATIYSTRAPQTPIERQRKLRANVLLIVVTMIWGSSFLIVQHTLTLVGPLYLPGNAFWVCSVILLAILFRKRLIHITYTEI